MCSGSATTRWSSLAAALVAAPIAKFITKESRSLRFMESVMAGIIQYFIWLALFVALTFVIGGFGSTSTSGKGSPSAQPRRCRHSGVTGGHAAASPSPSSSTANAGSTPTIVTTPVVVAGLAVIDILSFVGTFYPLSAAVPAHADQAAATRGPRPPKEPTRSRSRKERPQSAKSNVDRLDDAQARDTQTEGPDALTIAFSEVRSLYLHIPFCERKCEYCDFTSVAGATGSAAYMDALWPPRSGASASAWDGCRSTRCSSAAERRRWSIRSCLRALVATVRNTFSVADDAEVTMEANPSSIERGARAGLEGAGVNRISIGVQSLEADALKLPRAGP